jgi:ribosome-binding ATPase YchF (GTP1/OBG family)
MDVGIVGVPGSGRTTLFLALLALRAPKDAAGRRGAIGTIQVRDPRLDRLAERLQPERVVPIEFRIHDLCTSLDSSFPTAEVEGMKRMDGLLLVVPAFLDPTADASQRELDRLVSDLCLEDLAAVERRLERAKKEKIEDAAREALERARGVFECERPLYTAEIPAADRETLQNYSLVTDRPWIAVRNVGEAEAGAPVPSGLRARGEAVGCPVLSLCATLEAETAELSPDERAEFLREYGVSEPAGAAVTRAMLERADRISFFTVVQDECRAWAIPRGTEARKAAGRIHTDMERGFIRAEVIPFEEWEALPGGLGEARKLGKLRLHGKDYVIQDGDIVHFRFNV